MKTHVYTNSPHMQKYANYYSIVAILKLNEEKQITEKSLTCDLKTGVLYFYYFESLISVRAASDSYFQQKTQIFYN